jgi:hypothetical protein
MFKPSFWGGQLLSLIFLSDASGKIQKGLKELDAKVTFVAGLLMKRSC